MRQKLTKTEILRHGSILVVCSDFEKTFRIYISFRACSSLLLREEPDTIAADSSSDLVAEWAHRDEIESRARARIAGSVNTRASGDRVSEEIAEKGDCSHPVGGKEASPELAAAAAQRIDEREGGKSR